MSDVSLVREDGATSYQLMTASDYLVAEGLPEHSELVRGKVVEMNQPSKRHGKICSRIAFLLQLHAERNDCGHVLTNDSGVLTEEGPDSVRGPDVAYYSYSRIAKNAMPDDYSGPAPELVFEVLSKTDRWSTTLRKAGEYLGVDVLVVCIVIPRDRTVRLFRGDGTDITLTENDVLQLPEIQPTFEIKVSELFA